MKYRLIAFLLLILPFTSFAQTTKWPVIFVKDFVLDGTTTDKKTVVDIYVDGEKIDRIHVTNGKFHYEHSQFGKGTHKVRVVERRPGADKVLLENTFNAKCDRLKAWNYATQWWCKEVPTYWDTRQKDTTLLFNDKIKIGINNSLGGGITQLYTSDRRQNLVSEHGGALIQLSLWGPPAIGPNPKDGHWGFNCQQDLPMQSVLNPIQASGKNCGFEDKFNDVTEKKKLDCGQCWWIRKVNPYQFTHAGNLPGMEWSQLVKVYDEGYAHIEYKIAYDGISLLRHPQEIPAMQLAMGNKAKVYWKGSKGIESGTISANEKGFVISYLTRAYSASRSFMIEPWYSICSTDEKYCLTVIFPQNNTYINQFEFSLTGASGVAYATPLGWFPLEPGLRMTMPMIIAPVKYDKVSEKLLLKTLVM